jgi:predicted DNA-binding transcriptional regulator AlpA
MEGVVMPEGADADRSQLSRLIDREQLARTLELRLGEVVAHAEQRGFPRPVAYYRGRMLWEERSIKQWLAGHRNP